MRRGGSPAAETGLARQSATHSRRRSGGLGTGAVAAAQRGPTETGTTAQPGRPEADGGDGQGGLWRHNCVSGKAPECRRSGRSLNTAKQCCTRSFPLDRTSSGGHWCGCSGRRPVVGVLRRLGGGCRGKAQQLDGGGSEADAAAAQQGRGSPATRQSASGGGEPRIRPHKQQRRNPATPEERRQGGPWQGSGYSRGDSGGDSVTEAIQHAARSQAGLKWSQISLVFP